LACEDHKLQEYEKIDYYLAQIALCASQKNGSINDYLIRYDTPELKKKRQASNWEQMKAMALATNAKNARNTENG